jgi:hypothetical protein
VPSDAYHSVKVSKIFFKDPDLSTRSCGQQLPKEKYKICLGLFWRLN